MALLNKEETKK